MKHSESEPDDSPRVEGKPPSHSLALYASLLEPVLRGMAPCGLCEVGVEGGHFASWLLDFCAASGGWYTGIDPGLDEKAAAALTARGGRVVAKPSLQALAEIEPHAVYFLDGDHNHYTVFSELELILARAQSSASMGGPGGKGRTSGASHAGRRAHPLGFPLVCIHDVGWPCARRDLYFSPYRVPDGNSRPTSPGLGVRIGVEQLSEGGLVPENDSYRWATDPGGPGNGVLTAVEDFLAAHRVLGLEFFTVAPFFGLGFLYRPTCLPAHVLKPLRALRAGVARFGEFLAVAEQDRVAWLLRSTDAERAVRETWGRMERAEAEAMKERAVSRELMEDMEILRGAAAQLESDNRALKEGLEWHESMSARYWSEAEGFKRDLEWQKDVTSRYWSEAEGLKRDLEWQKDVTSRYWKEAGQLKEDLRRMEHRFQEKQAELAAANERIALFERRLALPLAAYRLARAAAARLSRALFGKDVA